MTEYEDLAEVEIRDLLISTLFVNQDLKSKVKCKVQRRYSGLFTPLNSIHNSVTSISHFDEQNPSKTDFPDGTRITRRMSACYNCDGNKWTENKVEETEKEDLALATRKDKSKIPDSKRYLRRKSCSDVNKTSEEDHSSTKDAKIRKVKNIKKAVCKFPLDTEHNEDKENNEKIKTVKINKRYSLSDTEITGLKTESIKRTTRQRKSMNNILIQVPEHNKNEENNEKIKTVEISKRYSLSDTEIADLKTESTKRAKRQRKSMNNMPVQYTENNTEHNQLSKAENDILKQNNEIFQIFKKSPTLSENTNMNVEDSLEIWRNNYTINKSELLNQNQYDEPMSIKNYPSNEQKPNELSLEHLEIDVTDYTMECHNEDIEQYKINNTSVQESNYSEDIEILKHYTDKTIKPFNKLETIFENSKGETVMSKRKLKRYINFEDMFTAKRQSKRKTKVRKMNPSFNLELLDLDYLQSLY
ncbi:uncharacterized protein LOC114334646 [Diabrotica virgifera virgifera]|uniref:Uncharacterized protein LOC114334646 n=1 Tax=Diabrotica virgifera virgifera TaxID=50390 RepID=A0A6P7G0E8_DIAVI|nr:uncharacterized protein LOC114334646 [Diabrotica virgifera virgifera]